MSSDVRPELTKMPRQIAKLPVARGYPVPWFVAWLDGTGDPVERGQGEPEFRVIAPGAFSEALKGNLCWICGGKMAVRSPRAFVVGAMCALNRISAEPPSHLECGRWAIVNCPFLTRPHARRRETGLPEDAREAGGVMLKRNPGVGLLWVTTTFAVRKVRNGILFDMGEPTQVEWYSEARAATRAEVEDAIATGVPLLNVQTAEAESLLAELMETVRTLMPTT